MKRILIFTLLACALWGFVFGPTDRAIFMMLGALFGVLILILDQLKQINERTEK